MNCYYRSHRITWIHLSRVFSQMLQHVLSTQHFVWFLNSNSLSHRLASRLYKTEHSSFCICFTLWLSQRAELTLKEIILLGKGKVQHNWHWVQSCALEAVLEFKWVDLYSSQDSILPNRKLNFSFIEWECFPPLASKNYRLSWLTLIRLTIFFFFNFTMAWKQDTFSTNHNSHLEFWFFPGLVIHCTIPSSHAGQRLLATAPSQHAITTVNRLCATVYCIARWLPNCNRLR